MKFQKKASKPKYYIIYGGMNPKCADVVSFHGTVGGAQVNTLFIKLLYRMDDMLKSLYKK